MIMTMRSISFFLQFVLIELCLASKVAIDGLYRLTVNGGTGPWFCARRSNRFKLLYDHRSLNKDSDEFCKALQDGGVDSKPLREKLYTIDTPSMVKPRH